MKSEQRTVTLGAAIVAAGLSFAAGSYIAVADRNPPVRPRRLNRPQD
jgi:hypothetical protein